MWESVPLPFFASQFLESLAQSFLCHQNTYFFHYSISFFLIFYHWNDDDLTFWKVKCFRGKIAIQCPFWIRGAHEFQPTKENKPFPFISFSYIYEVNFQIDTAHPLLKSSKPLMFYHTETQQYFSYFSIISRAELGNILCSEEVWGCLFSRSLTTF